MLLNVPHPILMFIKCITSLQRLTQADVEKKVENHQICWFVSVYELNNL